MFHRVTELTFNGSQQCSLVRERLGHCCSALERMSQKYQNEVIESCLFVFFYFVKTHQSQARSRSVSKQIFDYRGVIFVSVSISMDFSCQKLIRFNEIHKLRATSESTLSKSLWSDPIKLSIQWTIIIELKQHVINDKLGFHQRAKKKQKMRKYLPDVKKRYHSSELVTFTCCPFFMNQMINKNENNA